MMLIATRADDAQANSLMLNMLAGLAGQGPRPQDFHALNDLHREMRAYRQAQVYKAHSGRHGYADLVERDRLSVVKARVGVRLQIIQVRLARCS